MTISIDADGQDDLNAMNDMLTAYEDMAVRLFMVRSDRKSDSWFKQVSASELLPFHVSWVWMSFTIMPTIA